jgi:hypothetical protein
MIKLKLPNFLRDMIIDFQRWNFRRKYDSVSNADLKNSLKAIEKANMLAKKRNHRLWVVRISPGKFRIYTKADVKAVLKRLGIEHEINMFQLGNEIVHITK